MPNADQELLTDAIARNTALVVSLPSAGLLRHYKSRFLRQADNGFWIELIPQEQALIAELSNNGKPVGIAFKSADQKVTLQSSILAIDPALRINGDLSVAAMLIAAPSQVRSVQRRETYRVRIAPGSAVKAKVWRMPPRAHLNDRPQPSQMVAVELRDLSLGGIGVIVRGTNGCPPKISTSDRLRIELSTPYTTLLLEGTMREPSGSQPDNAVSAGIRFKSATNDLSGRQALNQLNKIIGELQREEVKKARLRSA